MSKALELKFGGSCVEDIEQYMQDQTKRLRHPVSLQQL